MNKIILNSLSFLSTNGISILSSILVLVVAPIVVYKIKSKEEIKNKNSIDKLGYRVEIMNLIKKVDDHLFGDYNEYYNSEAFEDYEIKHQKDLNQYDDTPKCFPQRGNSQLYVNSIDRIKFLIELHFPKLVNSYNEYKELADVYNDPLANYDDIRERGRNFYKKRKEFVEELRKASGL